MGDIKSPPNFYFGDGKMKKLNKDENAITGWSLIGIILIAILVWQFAGGYLGITTPFDLINPEPDTLTHSVKIKDIVDLSYHDMNSVYQSEWDLQSGHIYQLEFSTNAHYQTPDSYRYTVLLKWKNGTQTFPDWTIVQTETHLISYDAIWKNTWNSPLNIHSGDERFWIEINFYNPNGVLLGNYQTLLFEDGFN